MGELNLGALPLTEPPATNNFDYITQSQKSWRRLKRGIISRPVEIPSLSRVLDNSIKKVFSKYISAERPPPVVAWSVLRDEPLETDAFQDELRFPEGVTPQDEDAYLSGIIQLNEWGTDFAASYWLSHAPKHSVFQKLGKLYADYSVNSGHKTVYEQAFKVMERLKLRANKTGQNFEDAVFTALFKHDFSPINMIITQANIADCKSLDDVALYLGKKSSPNAVYHTAQKLSPRDNESKLKKLSKRVLLSMLTSGRQEYPGVVEVLVNQSALAFMIGTAGGAAGSDILVGITTGTVGGAIMSTRLGYTLIHETVHDYQSDERFSGFIPGTVLPLGESSEKV